MLRIFRPNPAGLIIRFRVRVSLAPAGLGPDEKPDG